MVKYKLEEDTQETEPITLAMMVLYLMVWDGESVKITDIGQEKYQLVNVSNMAEW